MSGLSDHYLSATRTKPGRRRLRRGYTRRPGGGIIVDSPGNTGAFDPSWEFPWLSCGSKAPQPGEAWGNAACR